MLVSNKWTTQKAAMWLLDQLWRTSTFTRSRYRYPLEPIILDLHSRHISVKIDTSSFPAHHAVDVPNEHTLALRLPSCSIHGAELVHDGSMQVPKQTRVQRHRAPRQRIYYTQLSIDRAKPHLMVAESESRRCSVHKTSRPHLRTW